MPVCLKCGTERSSHYRLCLCEPGGLAERSNEQTSDLRSRITTLEAQLTHLQEQAGPDSCADLMVRCERAEARAERYEKCLRKLLTHLPPPPRPVPAPMTSATPSTPHPRRMEMDNGFRVFSVLEDCYEPWSSEPHAVLAWYWQDDECDAPIGPFGSERAAKANYHEYLHHGAPTPQTKDPA